MELYINNIFINPEIHKIYMAHIGFSLIRVHREQLYTADTDASTEPVEVLLQQMKWPIEYLFIGMKVKNYHAGTTDALKRQHLDKWHTFHTVTETTYETTGQSVMKESALVVVDAGTETLGITSGLITYDGDTVGAAVSCGVTLATLSGTALMNVAVAAGSLVRINGGIYTVANTVAAGAAASGVNLQDGPMNAYTVEDAATATAVVAASTAIAAGAKLLTPQGLSYTTKSCSINMDTLTVKAHGIPIYDNFPTEFFNSYISYHYGGGNINTPDDCGAYFIPFCLYPGIYQPSGHINVSRAREFYVEYTSALIDDTNEGTLVIYASALNFLLISNGAATLRYAT